VCDGYGVWGGGGNFYGYRQGSALSSAQSATPWRPASVSVLSGSQVEKLYLEWFNCRTVKKIPGPFAVTFWDRLLLQASMTEPAVLHAVLTLSSIHKDQGNWDVSLNRGNRSVDDPEQFMHQHYIEAIRKLQPHFLHKDRASIRVALITCVVFVCLEFLRGHFQTAPIHLESGLKVLK
jgi:hypothetical protein